MKWLLLLATLLYPLMVYLALGRVALHWVAILLTTVAIARAISARQGFWWLVAAGTTLLAALAYWRQDAVMLKLYPVWVNVVLLLVFGFSLYKPPSAVERIARLQEPDLPPFGVHYTRQVTKVWCVFFALNAGVAAATALYGSDASWALYNGLIAYVLIASLMAIEWVVRQRLRRRTAVQ